MDKKQIIKLHLNEDLRYLEEEPGVREWLDECSKLVNDNIDEDILVEEIVNFVFEGKPLGLDFLKPKEDKQ